MRHLQKPQISTEDILKDCVASYRKETRDGIKIGCMYLSV